jgi:hypothetical protein
MGMGTTPETTNNLIKSITSLSYLYQYFRVKFSSSNIYIHFLILLSADSKQLIALTPSPSLLNNIATLITLQICRKIMPKICQICRTETREWAQASCNIHSVCTQCLAKSLSIAIAGNKPADCQRCPAPHCDGFFSYDNFQSALGGIPEQRENLRLLKEAEGFYLFICEKRETEVLL